MVERPRAGDELEALIAEQAADAANFRTWNISLESLGDSAYTRQRGTVSDQRHGKEYLYQRGCHCAKCRAAHAEYRQARRLAGKEQWGPWPRERQAA